MEDRKQLEQNALQILAKAADKYLAAQDDLGKSFIGPQLSAAVGIIARILEERWAGQNEANPAESESLKESEVTPDPKPAVAKKAAKR